MNYVRKHENAIVPKYVYPDDSGFDVGPIHDVWMPGKGVATFRTGLAFEIPEGCEIQIRPRGSVSKQGVHITLGTVDGGYRGELFITAFNFTAKDIFWNAGQRVAQCVVCPVLRPELVEVESLPPTLRGEGRFGHTGA